jgi:RNA polymerase sigma factor (sigma-70 family)
METIGKPVQNFPDEKIMEIIKEGNLSGMCVLFERYNRKLYNFFLRMGLKNDISQDLTQNLFYRMIKYRHTYRNSASVKTWIYQIARNLHNDFRNEEKRSGDMFMTSGVYPSDIPEEPDNYAEEDFERLDRALMTLSDAQREILILSRYQGLKYEEISSVVKQSVPAIKVAVYRAIKQLRSVYFRQN